MNENHRKPLSVIVNVCNEAWHLIRCVESVMKSRDTDFELLLIFNSETTQEALEIVNEYRELDSRITLLRSEEKSLAAMLNRGLDRSSGRWVTFIDPRDYVDPSFLGEMMESTRRPESGEEPEDLALVAASVNLELGASHPSVITLLRGPSAEGGPVSVDEFIEEAAPQGVAMTTAKLFRRDLIERASLHFSEEASSGCSLLFTLGYLRAATEERESEGPVSVDSADRGIARVATIYTLGYHYEPYLRNSMWQGDELIYADGPRKAIEVWKRIYELSEGFSSHEVRLKLQSMLLSNLLDILATDATLKELLPKERREVYEMIYLLVDPSIIRNRMPWYFDIFGSFHAWRIYDMITRR